VLPWTGTVGATKNTNRTDGTAAQVAVDVRAGPNQPG